MIEEGSEELSQTEIRDHLHKQVGAFYPEYDVEPNQEAYLQLQHVSKSKLFVIFLKIEEA